MKCNRIRLRNFRNIESADVAFDDGVNILLGENAQGKTNLLESIGFAAIGKSFRTAHDEEMIRFGEDFAEISMDFSDSQREQNITVRLMNGKRRHIEHNKVKIPRVSDVVGLFRTVLFCPEHLSLIKDGPAERRGFLDIALSQLYPVYLKSLQKYNQILKNRNQLIRDAEENRSVFEETVDLWSYQLAHEAAVLTKYRQVYVEQMEAEMQNCFSEMTGTKEVPSAVYEGSCHGNRDVYLDVAATEDAYRKLLTENHEREIGAGTTLWGIHKDDIDIRINDKSSRLYASQGQQRSLALAMKLAEGEVSGKICGEKPVFLFDDVFSELDENRKNYLASKMKDRQVIITTCEHAPTDGRIIRVRDGKFEN